MKFFLLTLFSIAVSYTAWKVSKCGVFSGLYFPSFGLNTDRYLSLRIQSEYRKIRTRKNSVFGHISHSLIDLKLGNLNHLFSMHSFSTPWKHQNILRLSDVFKCTERVYLNRCINTFQKLVWLGCLNFSWRQSVLQNCQIS